MQRGRLEAAIGEARATHVDDANDLRLKGLQGDGEQAPKPANASNVQSPSMGSWQICQLPMLDE